MWRSIVTRIFIGRRREPALGNSGAGDVTEEKVGKGRLKPMSGWVTSSDELTFEMLTSLRVFNADMILHQNIHPWPHMVCDSPSAHRHPPLTSHGSWLLKCAQLIKLLFKITSGSEYKVKSANLYLLDVGCIMYMKILFKDTQNKALVVPCI